MSSKLIINHVGFEDKYIHMQQYLYTFVFSHTHTPINTHGYLCYAIHTGLARYWFAISV